MTSTTRSKLAKWGDGGEMCNVCVKKPAQTVGLCEDCKKLPEPRGPATLALARIVKEYKITRRQVRDLRRLRCVPEARTHRKLANIYMKCARILSKTINESGGRSKP